MRRVLPAVLPAILAVALTVGCSRHSPPHIGEWSADFFLAGDVPVSKGTWRFLDNGTIQAIYEKPPAAPYVLEGRFTFDYSKNPIQLDINWNDNVTLRGIARFVGESKNRMHIVYSSSSPGRPAHFEGKEPFWWLTKKVKK
jgi:hypothetical protein